MTAGRMRGVLGRGALLVAGLLVAILALEGLLRLAVPQWRGLVAQRFMTTTPGGVLAGVPGYDGRVASLFGEFDVPVRLDGRGFRNPPAADPAAPLAFVGDSFCFGWGVLPEQSFATLAAERLGMPAYNYCTVGADLLDDLEVVRAWMPARPGGATVLTVTFENDVLAYPATAGDGGPSATVQALSRSQWSGWLMTHSALFNVATTLARMNPTIVALVHRLGLMSGVPVGAAGGTDPIAASVRLIGRIRDAAGTGPFLVVLVPPRPGQVALVDYDAFVAALTRAGFDVLDPRADPGLEISTIPRDGHWDAATHAQIAPRVAERLRGAGVR
jgi:hypothetical protein